MMAPASAATTILIVSSGVGMMLVAMTCATAVPSRNGPMMFMSEAMPMATCGGSALV